MPKRPRIKVHLDIWTGIVNTTVLSTVKEFFLCTEIIQNALIGSFTSYPTLLPTKTVYLGDSRLYRMVTWSHR